ncbi:unnamed protein product [Thlaspi arvense]|uniref:BZIP domain-containing protein n=1 Tax=Thlaspi arvense TaxID=13288 RepID=A0AAU9SXK7_THLAR|nr:unnamed protein product [Thlaspi arvense]
MSSVRQTSSSSNASMGDERKRKRMISNRDSARRSRMRKQKLLEDLTSDLGRLQCENKLILCRIDEVKEGYTAVAADNCVLRAQVAELVARLGSLAGVLRGVGLKLDSPDA